MPIILSVEYLVGTFAARDTLGGAKTEERTEKSTKQSTQSGQT